MKTWKSWLAAALILFLAGIIICGVGFILMGFDFTQLEIMMNGGMLY